MLDRMLKTATAGLAVAAVALAGCGGSSSDSSSSATAASDGRRGRAGRDRGLHGQADRLPGRRAARAQAGREDLRVLPVLDAGVRAVRADRRTDAEAARLQAQRGQGRAVGQRGAKRDGLDPVAQAGRRGAAGRRSATSSCTRCSSCSSPSTPVSANGIVEPGKYGIQSDFINDKTDTLAGKLMADWAVAHGGGEVAFYGVPELSFTPIIADGLRPRDGEGVPGLQGAPCRHPGRRDRQERSEPRRLRPPVAPEHQDGRLRDRRGRHRPSGGAPGGPAEGAADRLGPPPAILGYIKQGQWDAGDRRRRLHDAVGADRRARADGLRPARDGGREGGAAADPDPEQGATSTSTRRRAGRRIPTSRSASPSCGGPRNEARVLPCRRRRPAGGRRRRRDRRPRRRRPLAATRRWPSCSDAGPECLERVREIAESRRRTGCRSPASGSRAPVQPRKFFAIGLNYADHVAESGQPTPEHLTVFIKAAHLRHRARTTRSSGRRCPTSSTTRASWAS